MKKITLTPLVLLLFTILGYSQGIAIQGIARDANNTALINQNLALTFNIYYIDANGANQSVFTETQTITTDAYGVFSHILNNTGITDSRFANNKVSLRITYGNLLISDEPFTSVPYVYAASNGTPTGSIAAFVGITPPDGWIFCNGSFIEVKRETAALRKLLGSSYAPDLRGVFLRGTGTNSIDAIYSGPALGSFQTDEVKSHLHDAGGLETNRTGEHAHDFYKTGENRDHYGTSAPWGAYYYFTQTQEVTLGMKPGGAHTHSILGNTQSTGTESRPFNMGVNYIIKL